MPANANLDVTHTPEFQARILAFRRADCEICQHQDEATGASDTDVLEHLITSGQFTYAAVAQAYGLSREGLRIHMAKHVPPEIARLNVLRQSKEFRAAVHTVTTRQKAERTHELLFEAMSEAKDDKDFASLSALAKPTIDSLRVLGELDGNLGPVAAAKAQAAPTAANVQVAMVLPNTWKPPAAAATPALPPPDDILDGDPDTPDTEISTPANPDNQPPVSD